MNPDLVYLVQTDTTVGFCSQSEQRLCEIKQRASTKPFLKTVPNFATLKEMVRVPKKYRSLVRRATKTTFIYPNKNSAIRVSNDEGYNRFLQKFGWMYSTSANRSGESYDSIFAQSACDVIVQTPKPLTQKRASHIFLLADKLRRVR